ncbi:MAG: hypothetical protein V1866_05460 [archaeon]
MDRKTVLGLAILLMLIAVAIFVSGSSTDCGGIGGTGCNGTDHFTNCTTYGCLFVYNKSNSVEYTARFDEGGFYDSNNPGVLLESQTSITVTPGFLIRNSTDIDVASINVNARLRLAGAITEDQKFYCTPPTNNSFIIQDSSGNCVAYIDQSGNMWLRGKAGYNANIERNS